MSEIDLWYTTRASGIVALVLLTATMFLGILVAGRAKSSLPAFARADIHRRLSIVTIAFLAMHVLTSVLDSFVNVGWPAVVLPFMSSYHRFWLALGTIGVDLFLAVAISSAFRQWISARTWRRLHWLAYLSWPVAVAHTLGMGTDTKLDWMLVLVAGCIASIVGVGLWRFTSGVRVRAALPVTMTTARRSLRATATGKEAR